MTSYIVRRLLLALPVLLGVSVLVFLILHLTPGNPALVMAGPDAPPDVVREVEKALGLDQPLYVQYGRYLARILRADFGRSIQSREQVFERLIATFPVTLTLAVVGVVVTTTVSVPMGILAAYHRNSPLDLATIFLVLTGSAMPVFAIGLILLWIFAIRLRWFPLSGFESMS